MTRCAGCWVLLGLLHEPLAAAQQKHRSEAPSAPTESPEIGMAEPAADALPQSQQPKPAPSEELATQRRQAKALFEQGRHLVNEGKVPEGCRKFEESLALRKGLGTEFNLADCYQRDGRTASAWKLFDAVAKTAEQRDERARAEAARSRANELEPRVARLSIIVPDEPDDVSLYLDDALIPRSEWASATPMDPGRYHLQAEAPGHSNWSAVIEVPASGGTVAVAIPKLEASARAEKVVPKRAEGTLAPVADAPAHDIPKRTRNAAITYGLIGGVAVGTAGGATGLILYNMWNNRARDICPSGRGCTDKEIADHEENVQRARTARTMSYVGLGVASASLVGLGIYLLTGRSDENTAATSVEPWMSGEGAGAAWRGTW